MHAGMARFTCHDPNNVWDLVPCDTVASAILLTAAAITSKACTTHHWVCTMPEYTQLGMVTIVALTLTWLLSNRNLPAV